MKAAFLEWLAHVESWAVDSAGRRRLAQTCGRQRAEVPNATSPCLQGIYQWHQYQVVGRHLPTAADENPTVYRMKVWAQDKVQAKSKFW